MELKLRFTTFLVTTLLGTMPYFSFASDAAEKSSTSGRFDQTHSMWTQFLQKHVKKSAHSSTVNYKEIKRDPSKLETYLKALESVSQDEFNRFSNDERLAFLINSYNAFTVKLIVDHYPVKSIKDIGSLFSSPWKKKFFRLLGEERSLDNIEHDMIRKQFNEPRIHFAVNCASVGCPALRDEAFVASGLDKQLEDASVSFLSDKTRNRYNPETKKLELSSIFKWYGSDFPKKYGSLEAFLATRITSNPEYQKLVQEKKVNISYLDYDWSLNEEK
ncbi:MAG: DUF547 domain-containing protein [Pseudobdellovibrionaceae bacterium]